MLSLKRRSFAVLRMTFVLVWADGRLLRNPCLKVETWGTRIRVSIHAGGTAGEPRVLHFVQDYSCFLSEFDFNSPAADLVCRQLQQQLA
jgi:hypothetical protein